MKIKRKSVAEQANENLEVIKNKEIVKEGSHVDHSRKHLDSNTIGASVGVTKNMGEYESLRVDVWATVDVGDRTMDEAYKELFDILDSKIEEAVESYVD